MDFPSVADLRLVGKNAAAATPGTQIDVTQVDVDGSDLNLINNISADMADEVIQQLSISDRGRFLDTAVGDEIDRLGLDWYNLPRKPAIAAVGYLQLTRPTHAAGAGIIPAGTRLQNALGQVFSLLQPASFSALGLKATAPGGTSNNIPAQAALLGAASGAAAGTTTWSWTDPIFDTTVTIANLQALIGADVELDPAYKARIRGYFLTVQEGTLAAIQNKALTVPGVSQAVALDVTAEDALGNIYPQNFVQLFIGDVDGQSNAYLIAQVQVALVTGRGGGIYVQVIGGTPEEVWITISNVSVPAGVDPVQAASTIQAAVVSYVNSLQPGQPLRIDAIYGAAKGAGTQATIASGPKPPVTVGVTQGDQGTIDLTAVITPTGAQVFRTDAAQVAIQG